MWGQRKSGSGSTRQAGRRRESTAVEESGHGAAWRVIVLGDRDAREEIRGGETRRPATTKSREGGSRQRGDGDRTLAPHPVTFTNPPSCSSQLTLSSSPTQPKPWIETVHTPNFLTQTKLNQHVFGVNPTLNQTISYLNGSIHFHPFKANLN